MGRCALGRSASSSCAARSLSVCSCILDPCAMLEMLELMRFSSLLVRLCFFPVSPEMPSPAILPPPPNDPSDTDVSRLVVDMLRAISGLDMADDGAGGGAGRLSDLRRVAKERQPPSMERRAKLKTSPRCCPCSRLGELGVLRNDDTDAERTGWKEDRRKEVAELARWWCGDSCGLEWNSNCWSRGESRDSTVTTESAMGALSLWTMVVRTDMDSDFGVTVTLPSTGVFGTTFGL